MTFTRLFAASLFLTLSAAARADVLINEIMYHPSSENPAEEYIELYNSGAVPVALGGWKITSGVTFTFPAVSIPAGGYLVVASNQAAFTAKYSAVTNFVAGWTGQLSNSSNTITLRDLLLVKVDEVNYSDDGDWGQRERDNPADFGHRGWGWNSDADGLGKSLELINALFDNNVGQNWKPSVTAQGTPGVANSVAASDIAPVITDAAHFPLIPASTNTVAVYAKMTDDHASAITATLRWRVDGGSFTTTAMFDDGTHGDGAAGDGVYGVILSPQGNGVIVEFYFQATDATAHTRTWPAPAKDYTGTFGQFCNCLYQVDGTIYAGAQPIYRLVMKGVDKTELSNINSDTGTPPFAFNAGETNDQTYSHARFNTTFVSRDGTGSKLRYLSGTRNRGNSSRYASPQSFNLTFPNADGWNGVHGVNLNTQNTPYQLAGSALFRKAGLATAESRAVQLRWNAVNPATGTAAPAYGFYVCNEAEDSDFVDHHFPTDSSGNLYRALRQDSVGGANLRDQSAGLPAATADPTPYRVNYFKHTNTSEDKWADLIGLTKTLAKGHSIAATYATSWDADYVTSVQAAVDVNQAMRFMAVSTIADNTETNISNGDGDDYYLYFGGTDPRANFIAYDLDSILGRSAFSADPKHNLFRMSRSDASGNPPEPIHPFMSRPEFARVYFQELKRLLDGAFSPAQLDQTLDETLGGLISPGKIQEMKTFNLDRRAYILGGTLSDASVETPKLFFALGNMGAQTTAGTPLTITSGYPHSTAATCNVTGKADCRFTASVKVNGVAATYTPWKVTNVATFATSVGDWTASNVALTPGLNRLHIQSFDSTGVETEQSYFDVWYDDASVASVSGAIAGNTTWTAAGGPYQVTANLTVNSGVTLTIQPGTTVYLNSGITMTVAAGGRILAEGTAAQPIRFTRAPGLATNGGSIIVNGQAGVAETHIYYTFFEFGGDPAVVCNANSNVILDHCEWLRTDVAYLHLDGGSFIVSNCIFPTANATSYFEGVHGNIPTPAGGRAIIRDCFFGKCHSINGNYNDVLDFTSGNRPGAIIQFYNNV
ncbi:MAG: lamin tail domain-containing protein, partial [Chthoniobacteraceae bacterium]